MGNRYRLFVGRTARTSRPALYLGRDWSGGVPSAWLAVSSSHLRAIERDDLELEAESIARARFRGTVDVVNVATQYGAWTAYAPDAANTPSLRVEFTVDPWQ